MESFAIGLLSFLCAVAFPLIYYISYQVRRFIAWTKRANPPSVRLGFMIAFTAVVGFVFGCFAQPLWNKAAACRAYGVPVVPCVLDIGKDDKGHD